MHPLQDKYDEQHFNKALALAIQTDETIRTHKKWYEESVVNFGTGFIGLTGGAILEAGCITVTAGGCLVVEALGGLALGSAYHYEASRASDQAFRAKNTQEAIDDAAKYWRDRYDTAKTPEQQAAVYREFVKVYNQANSALGNHADMKHFSALRSDMAKDRIDYLEKRSTELAAETKEEFKDLKSDLEKQSQSLQDIKDAMNAAADDQAAFKNYVTQRFDEAAVTNKKLFAKMEIVSSKLDITNEMLVKVNKFLVQFGEEVTNELHALTARQKMIIQYINGQLEKQTKEAEQRAKLAGFERARKDFEAVGIFFNSLSHFGKLIGSEALAQGGAIVAQSAEILKDIGYLTGAFGMQQVAGLQMLGPVGNAMTAAMAIFEVLAGGPDQSTLMLQAIRDDIANLKHLVLAYDKQIVANQREMYEMLVRSFDYQMQMLDGPVIGRLEALDTAVHALREYIESEFFQLEMADLQRIINRAIALLDRNAPNSDVTRLAVLEVSSMLVNAIARSRSPTFTGANHYKQFPVVNSPVEVDRIVQLIAKHAAEVAESDFPANISIPYLVNRPIFRTAVAVRNALARRYDYVKDISNMTDTLWNNSQQYYQWMQSEDGWKLFKQVHEGYIMALERVIAAMQEERDECLSRPAVSTKTPPELSLRSMLKETLSYSKDITKATDAMTHLKNLERAFAMQAGYARFILRPLASIDSAFPENYFCAPRANNGSTVIDGITNYYPPHIRATSFNDTGNIIQLQIGDKNLYMKRIDPVSLGYTNKTTVSRPALFSAANFEANTAAWEVVEHEGQAMPAIADWNNNLLSLNLYNMINETWVKPSLHLSVTTPSTTVTNPFWLRFYKNSDGLSLRIICHDQVNLRDIIVDYYSNHTLASSVPPITYTRKKGSYPYPFEFGYLRTQDATQYHYQRELNVADISLMKYNASTSRWDTLPKLATGYQPLNGIAMSGFKEMRSSTDARMQSLRFAEQKVGNASRLIFTAFEPKTVNNKIWFTYRSYCFYRDNQTWAEPVVITDDIDSLKIAILGNEPSRIMDNYRLVQLNSAGNQQLLLMIQTDKSLRFYKLNEDAHQWQRMNLNTAKLTDWFAEFMHYRKPLYPPIRPGLKPSPLAVTTIPSLTTRDSDDLLIVAPNDEKKSMVDIRFPFDAIRNSVNLTRVAPPLGNYSAPITNNTTTPVNAAETVLRDFAIAAGVTALVSVLLCLLWRRHKENRPSQRSRLSQRQMASSGLSLFGSSAAHTGYGTINHENNDDTNLVIDDDYGYNSIPLVRQSEDNPNRLFNV